MERGAQADEAASDDHRGVLGRPSGRGTGHVDVLSNLSSGARLGPRARITGRRRRRVHRPKTMAWLIRDRKKC